MYNPETVAPCGLYCGVCGIYMATAGGDEELKGKLAKAYGVSPADILCRGCRSDTVFMYCKVCGIKACTAEKGIEGCHLCDAFPCGKVEAFPVAVPRWREIGTEKWVEEEEKLSTCRSCGNRMFRGAKKCRSCNPL
jgi:hypothetical protein